MLAATPGAAPSASEPGSGSAGHASMTTPQPHTPARPPSSQSSLRAGGSAAASQQQQQLQAPLSLERPGSRSVDGGSRGLGGDVTLTLNNRSPTKGDHGDHPGPQARDGRSSSGEVEAELLRLQLELRSFQRDTHAAVNALAARVDAALSTRAVVAPVANNSGARD